MGVEGNRARRNRRGRGWMEGKERGGKGRRKGEREKGDMGGGWKGEGRNGREGGRDRPHI